MPANLEGNPLFKFSAVVAPGITLSSLVVDKVEVVSSEDRSLSGSILETLLDLLFAESTVVDPDEVALLK